MFILAKVQSFLPMSISMHFSPDSGQCMCTYLTAPVDCCRATPHILLVFPIFSLEVYYQASTGTSKTEHTYVVFKTGEAIPILKKYLSGKDVPSYWKETCNIVSGLTKCPAPLIKLIESRERRGYGAQQGSSSSSTWRERGQTGKFC